MLILGGQQSTETAYTIKAGKYTWFDTMYLTVTTTGLTLSLLQLVIFAKEDDVFSLSCRS